MEAFLQYLDLIVFLCLLLVGYIAGSAAERRHYASIHKREKETLKFMLVTAEGTFAEGQVKNAFLVSGSVVISIDYFKRLLAILRNIFGGRVIAYETLLDRARREAILRMKEEARRKGAQMIINLRMETSSIGGGAANARGQVGSIEVIAFGTAITLNPR
jgi:uncharacterized protein YbjQ (UPF0145 family)